MADNLIFPIGFDLEKAVNEAGQQWDKKYADKLEKLLIKRPVHIKINFEKLEDVKKRLAELKLEPITPETKSAIKELASELKVLAKALEQVQKYTIKKGSANTYEVRAARLAEIEQKRLKQLEYTRIAAAKAEQAEIRLAAAREKSAHAAARTTSGVNALTKAYQTQSTYLDRLVTRMVTYWSFRQLGNFITGIREVTAEFELQRVSLGAIIQDQQRANQLFSEIKSFALQSPLKILDLTKYTKQVAAYGIETEKLFDTTKRLADVSVGLGVDMGRLVLAYGQVKAASYLRAAEIRQFTEAGIPMLELLAKKFTDLQGKMVSTEQVMDLVSKRAVSFSMVEDIFNDMTSAGGMFYNMQEKQAQTLFGMWSKLGDAAAMMYDEIGNTEGVNAGMKMTIGLLESMMRNWRLVGGEIIVVGAAMSIIAAKSKAQATATALQASALKKVRSAGIAYNAILAEEARLLKTGTAAQLQSVAARKSNAKAALDAAIAEKTAAATTNIWTRSIQKLKAALAGNWVTLLITAVAALGVAIYDAVRNATKLDRELQKIGAEGAANADAMVRNFERLANAVVESADGSKKQHEALEELKRTYSDIIPVQNLTIEKLRAMKGAYEDVAQAIREKVYQQNLERQISTIQEEYGGKISKGEEKTKELLASYGLDSNEIGRVMGAIDKAINDGLITAEDFVKDRVGIISKIIQDQTGKNLKFTYVSQGREWETAKFVDLSNAITKIVKPTEEMNAKIREQEEFMEGLTGKLGEYTNEWKRVQKEIEDNKIFAGPEDSQFLVSKQNDNRAIQSWAASLKNVLGNAWDETFVSLEESVGEKGDKMSYILFDKLMAPEVFEELSTQQKNYIKQIQDEYNNLIPQDRTVASMRNALERIALQTGVSMDEMKRHLMNSGESWEDYSKRIRDSIKEYESEIDEMIKSNAAVANGESGILKTYSDEEIKKVKDAAEALKLLLQYLAAAKGGGRTSDPRLQNLKEEISLTKKLYDEYHKLEKQIGATKAAEKIQQIYSNTIRTLQDRAKKYGFEFELPFTDENLKANMQHFIDKMKELQKEVDKKGKPKFPNIGKEIDEAVAQLEDVDFNSLQKALEKKLKELADRISRTKTAKEFYDKVLGMTGDINLATKVSMSIYGRTGAELKKQLAEQIRAYFANDEMKYNIDVPVNIINASNEINYLELEKFAKAMLDAGKIGKDTYDKVSKAAQDGQKDLAKTYEGYLKDLDKAKTYADKRVELARTTAKKIHAINADIAAGNITEDVGKTTIQGLQNKEIEESAKLEYEAFKDTPLYIQMFEDLGQASSYALESMKEKLLGLQNVWGSALDPTQLKEIQSRINEIDAQLRVRNPFKTLRESYQQYHDALKNYTVPGAEENVAAAQASYDKAVKDTGSADSKEAKAAERTLEVEKQKLEIAKQLTDEKGKALKGQKALDEAARIANENEARAYVELSEALANEEEAKANDGDVEAAHEAVEAAKEKLNLAQATSEIIQKEAKTSKTLKEAWLAAGQTISNIGAGIKEVGQSISSMMEAFGSASAEDIQFVDDISNAVGDIFAGVGDIIQSALSGDVVGIVTGAITAPLKIITGFANLFSAGKVRRANKEIRKQQELLEQLEYTYERLEKASDKLFGADYLQNYNQQLKNLQAQQQAYLKQAEAERSKGKKKDKEKIKEYENQARDTADKIKELQDELVAHFTGSSRTDVARQMAKSWIDARASMSDTFAAIKGDYQDLIKNMIVEGAAARVIENALSPVWDNMEKMLAKNDVQGAIDSLVNGMDSALNAANNGMEVLWKALEERGYDMKQLISDTDSGYTGIAKNVAGATSEEINTVAAIGNTLMYYVSPIPRMDENLAAIRAIMERGGTSALPTTASAGWTDWQQQAMNNYQAIATNTAETVVRCERAAVACEAFAADIHRMIEFSGGKHRLNVKL